MVTNKVAKVEPWVVDAERRRAERRAEWAKTDQQWADMQAVRAEMRRQGLQEDAQLWAELEGQYARTARAWAEAEKGWTDALWQYVVKRQPWAD